MDKIIRNRWRIGHTAILGMSGFALAVIGANWFGATAFLVVKALAKPHTREILASELSTVVSLLSHGALYLAWGITWLMAAGACWRSRWRNALSFVAGGVILNCVVFAFPISDDWDAYREFCSCPTVALIVLQGPLVLLQLATRDAPAESEAPPEAAR